MLIRLLFKSPLTLFLIPYMVLVGWLYFAQRSMVFQPDTALPSITQYDYVTPQTIQTATPDGIILTGWQFPAANSQMPTIIWFHGNAQNHATRAKYIKPFLDAGYGGVLASYRGYGGNKGKPTESGLYVDARAWIKRVKNMGVPLDNIILIGESLGSGVAVQMAVDFPDLKGLVLVAPFTSLIDVAKKRYFFVPVNLLMKDRFDNIDKISNISMPLMIFHWEVDPVVDAKFGRELFMAAKNPKKIVSFEGQGHTYLPYPRVVEDVSIFFSMIQ